MRRRVLTRLIAVDLKVYATLEAGSMALGLLEEEVARERIELPDRSQGVAQAGLIALRQAFDRHAVRCRRAVLDILDLLRDDEVEKHLLRFGQRIEIALAADTERLDAGEARRRRTL